MKKMTIITIVIIVLILLILILTSLGINVEKTDNDAIDINEADGENTQDVRICMVCGSEGTRTVVNKYSGELENYCDEHFYEIMDMTGNKADDKNEHSGLDNVLASAKQCSQIKYTPVSVLPSQAGDFPANTEITGLPYSSARANDKMIGNHVSIHTFLSAVQNPKSVLYTRKLTTKNAKTYYGMVCSAFVDYCYKIEPNFTCATYPNWDGLTEIQYSEIEIGDVLTNGKHVILITDIERDESGEITRITRTEGRKPTVRTTDLSWDSFVKKYETGKYKAYRCNDIENTAYEQLPYVCGYEDEMLADKISFPDIMSEFGDKAAFMAGETTVINVINPRDYSSICVKRNGAVIKSTDVIEDFTLSDLEPGMYEVSISNGKKTSATTFFVVDADCRYDADKKMVYFNSKNARPVAVYVYDDVPTCKVVELSPNDRANGSCDVSAFVNKDFKYVKIGFKCYYGVATWYSYDLHQWEYIN